MCHPPPEAYELVEEGAITPDHSRLVFANTVHPLGSQN
jgi:hypothetical protein